MVLLRLLEHVLNSKEEDCKYGSWYRESGLEREGSKRTLRLSAGTCGAGGGLRIFLQMKRWNVWAGRIKVGSFGAGRALA